jgi:hypothetical protein
MRNLKLKLQVLIKNIFMMKRNLLILAIILCSTVLRAQDNLITISSGYATAKISDSDLKGTGWNIRGLYEFNQQDDSKFLHGISFGFINTHASEGEQRYRLNSFPLYYAPKIMAGKGKLKGFLKGALGIQFSSVRLEGLFDLTDADMGLYAGAGAGIMLMLNEELFINAEYEIAWASNKYYKDGLISTIGGGIGIKFY